MLWHFSSEVEHSTVPVEAQLAAVVGEDATLSGSARGKEQGPQQRGSRADEEVCCLVSYSATMFAEAPGKQIENVAELVY